MVAIKVLVDAGKANAGPPIGPALGPLGINAMDVVNVINEKTKDMVGIQVPVQIIIDAQKNFTIEVGSPQTSAFIKKELGIQKAVGKVNEEVSGNLTFDQVLKVVKAKFSQLVSKDDKAAAKEVVGTCRSMGVTIDGKPSAEIIQKINDGAYDSKF